MVILYSVHMDSISSIPTKEFTIIIVISGLSMKLKHLSLELFILQIGNSGPINKVLISIRIM
jgi:hypothetical protein